jgi:syntaxin 1B/2/3
MSDRLAALRTKSNMPAAPTPPSKPPSNDPFAPFWEKYSAIQAKMDKIDSNIKDLQDLDDEMTTVADANKKAALNDQVKAIIKETTTEANTIRLDLDALRNHVQELDEEHPGTAEVRLQKNHLQVLRNDFTNVFTRFSNLQQNMKSRLKQDVQRQLRINNISKTDEEIEQIMQANPDGLQASGLAMSGGAKMVEAANLYNQIASRHQDILDIDREMTNLLDLFVQFSILVKDQGRQVDNIESNISAAADYVHKGAEYIEEAAEDQKKSRKCTWIICGICLVVLIVIIIIVVFFA